MSGRIEGGAVRLVDVDGNGEFNNYGVDAMVVGKSEGAGLVAPVVNLGGALYHFVVSTDGTRAQTRPYEGPVARLDASRGFESRGELLAAIFRSDLAAPTVADAPRGTEHS